jgi:predicted ester cyclase
MAEKDIAPSTVTADSGSAVEPVARAEMAATNGDVDPVAGPQRRDLGAGDQPRGTVPMSSLAAPGTKHARFMPPDFSISMRSGYGTATLDSTRSGKRHGMRGFDETYTDIVDFILRDTSRIWDDQDVGYIYDTYAPGCRVYDDNGMKYGVERVVFETIQSLNAFPDTRHYADDVIWAGDDDQGYATSHRAVNVGHHTGPWRWGPPTGRKLNTWVIANCVTRDNAIFQEWVLYNTAARLSQMGVDVVAAARGFGNEKGSGVHLSDQQSVEVERLLGGRNPEPYPVNDRDGNGFDVDYEVRALFHNVFNRRNLSAVDKAYAANVRWNGPTNRTGYGRAEVKGMARNLLATFPDLGMHVDEVYWMGNEADGFAVSARWTASGTHRGYGLYGRPTGRRVFIWGISQLYYVNGKIAEEWTLFNEFDMLSQILRDDAPGVLG